MLRCTQRMAAVQSKSSSELRFVSSARTEPALMRIFQRDSAYATLRTAVS